MAADYRFQRLDALRKTQNQDGGWGYFPGKRSWLEPTAYALLALHEAIDTPEWKKGWELIRSWQLPDGSFRPNAHVDEAHWSTALAVTLHDVREQRDESYRRAVNWLVGQRGAESSLLARFLGMFAKNHLGHDRKYAGWPWLPGTSSWIEPTAHALVALKKAAPWIKSVEIRRRIALAEGMILRRRCTDGGWNYGSRSALGVDLPSYPETTGLALLGLQSCMEGDLSPELAHAHDLWKMSTTRLGRAWLSVSLRNFGVNLPPETPVLPGRDIVATALEALASPGGGHFLLRPGKYA